MFFKRVLDLVISGLALLALSPVLLLVAMVIRVEDGGSAFFVQDRVGKGGSRFRLVKFRSMPVNTDAIPSASAGQLRITKVGRVIRRTNIDELPQLLNILRGDMSLVGPRPALPSQEALLMLRLKNGAHACKPGLTGTAQINSYDGMPETEKADFDGQYAFKISFFTDVLIILKTVGYLLRRPPVY